VIFSILANNNIFRGFQVNLVKEGLKIQYPIRNNPMHYLFIIVNAPILLNKPTIEFDDLTTFKKKYYSIIHERIFYHHEFLKSETLNRIDYKFDFKCKNQQEKKSLLTILSKARMKRYSASKRNYHDSEENPATVYYKANNYRVNTYDKEAEAVSRGYIEECNINLLRYELQILTGLLNNYEKRYGLKRTIDNYWYMRDYFFNEYLRPIFYIGDYYSNNIISRILNTSKNRDSLMQKIKEVQQLENVDNVYSYYQIKQIQNLNINPIQNNYNLMNPLNSIFKKAV
jgi:hypothetical protein